MRVRKTSVELRGGNIIISVLKLMNMLICSACITVLWDDLSSSNSLTITSHSHYLFLSLTHTHCGPQLQGTHTHTHCGPKLQGKDALNDSKQTTCDGGQITKCIPAFLQGSPSLSATLFWALSPSPYCTPRCCDPAVTCSWLAHLTPRDSGGPEPKS